MKKVFLIIALLITASTSFAQPQYYPGYLPYDRARTALQLFTPNPAYSKNITIANGSSYTLICAGWMICHWYADGQLQRKLGTNSAYYRGYGEMIGVQPALTQIVFSNISGGAVNIDIEGM